MQNTHPGRPERYLQMCAQHNMQVCMPTTPAQIYHLLRRQMLRPMRRPLVVLHRNRLLTIRWQFSSLQELAEGRFQMRLRKSMLFHQKGSTCCYLFR